jgi:SAM-dependent methyltransferase
LERKGENLQGCDKKSPEFDKFASSYAKLLDDPLRNRFAHDPLHFQRRKWLLIEEFFKSAGITPGTLRWLDVGCGQGEFLELAGKNFAAAMGCDPSAGMLPANAGFKTYQQPSLVVLPFGDQSVDFVTAVCVFHHVHGQDRTLLANEIRRVLIPGGLCCIIEHNPWNPVTKRIVKRCPVDVDAELLTAGQAIKMLAASGFASLNLKYFLYLPEGLFERCGAIEKLASKLPFGGQYAVLAQATS